MALPSVFPGNSAKFCSPAVRYNPLRPPQAGRNAYRDQFKSLQVENSVFASNSALDIRGRDKGEANIVRNFNKNLRLLEDELMKRRRQLKDSFAPQQENAGKVPSVAVSHSELGPARSPKASSKVLFNPIVRRPEPDSPSPEDLVTPCFIPYPHAISHKCNRRLGKETKRNRKRLICRDVFDQADEKREKLSEQRRMNRYLSRNNAETELKSQREQEKRKNDLLQLNRNNYQKYVTPMERGNIRL